VPSMVMLVNGVSASRCFPYQSIARTEACPPSQLQLKMDQKRVHTHGPTE
jgi:hypothetical protein